MVTESQPTEILSKVLKRWTELTIDVRRRERAFFVAAGLPHESMQERDAEDLIWITKLARRAEPFLHCFLQDNNDKSAEELEELASKLSPGGVHNGGLLVRLVRANLWLADPLVVAATIWSNWHGGKVGFQFLPDPAETELCDYTNEVLSLMDLFDYALNGDPCRLLTGPDRAFYQSLPDRLTIYRGCAGISAEKAGAGVCWTRNRDVAEWFANRSAGICGGGADPILMTARIGKHEIILAKASEFEIVTLPWRPRTLKCRRRPPTWRPEMEWRDGGFLHD